MAYLFLAIMLVSSVNSLHEEKGNDLHRIRREVEETNETSTAYSVEETNATTTPYSVINEFRKTMAHGEGKRPEEIYVPEQLWELEFGPNYTTPSTNTDVNSRRKRDTNSCTLDSGSTKRNTTGKTGPSCTVENVGTQIKDTSEKNAVNKTVEYNNAKIKEMERLRLLYKDDDTTDRTPLDIEDLKKMYITIGGTTAPKVKKKETIITNITTIEKIVSSGKGIVKSNHTKIKDKSSGGTKIKNTNEKNTVNINVKSNSTQIKEMDNHRFHTVSVERENTNMNDSGDSISNHSTQIKNATKTFAERQRELEIAAGENLTDLNYNYEYHNYTPPVHVTINPFADMTPLDIEDLKRMYIKIGGKTTPKVGKRTIIKCIKGVNFTVDVETNRTKMIGTGLNYTAINLLEKRERRKHYWARQEQKIQKQKALKRWEKYERRNLTVMKLQQEKLHEQLEKKAWERKLAARERRLQKRHNESANVQQKGVKLTRKARKILRNKKKKENKKRKRI